MKNTKSKTQKGFTLIELVVVVAVFMMVIGTAVSFFIAIVRNQSRIVAEEQLLSQTSYAMEYMSKALRMAKKDSTGSCLQQNGETYAGYIYLLTDYDTSLQQYRGIQFINSSEDDACEKFYLDYINPLDHSQGMALKRTIGDSEADLTSDKIKINKMVFSINGSDGGWIEGSGFGQSGVQPRVTVFMEATLRSGKDQPVRQLQTTISNRNLNISTAQ